jgi:hypothetical protein
MVSPINVRRPVLADGGVVAVVVDQRWMQLVANL